jgi:predicted nuclease of predicted toxin-antitoxin system
MKFLVDAQLPVRLARFLESTGYDTIHTKDLLNKNATSDTEINAISIRDNRIVITKDSDFLNSFLTIKEPYKLLLITTGNINNLELEALFAANLQSLVELFNNHSYIEMTRDSIIVHL